MVPQADIHPQQDAITEHLAHITRRWDELAESCLLELVFLTAEDRARVRQVNHYTPDANGIGMAVNDCLTWNKMGVNAYATVNPVSERNRPEAHKRAKAENIVASFFHWADADDAQAAENIRNFVGPKCTFFVLTGSQPSPRPHTYWELEEPTRNFPAWEATQKAIAATLATDSSVTDPPRIMRIAGTVNWPKPQKQDKGYVPELVTITIHDPEDRPPVSSERMARAFPGAPKGDADGFPIDTGVGPTLDRERLTQAVKSGNGWREHVVSLVASYVARGWSDEEIIDRCLAFTQPGYTQDDTRREVSEFILWTREQEGAKGGKYAVSPDTSQPAQVITSYNPSSLFKAWEVKDLSAIPTPEFVYSDFYARKYTSVTLAAPKVGKSMLGLAEAIDIATGAGILTGQRREKKKVVYYNAEDDETVIDNRVAALLTEYGIDQNEIAGWLYAQSGVENDDFYMVAGQEGVINEPLFQAIEAFIKDAGADVLIFDPLQDLSRSPETNEVFRLLGQRLRKMAASTGVALGLIHHTRKVSHGVTPSIDDMRGGSALRGTARFNRILIAMTEDEAAQSGVENHRHFMRIGDVESNLAPPSSDVNRWFEKVSVETPSGALVGAVKPWQWPDAFHGLTRQDAARVRHEIDQMAAPPRADLRSATWVGHVVGRVLNIDPEDKNGRARIKTIVSSWVKSDVLRITTQHDKRAGREVNIVVSGANDPLAEGGEA